jgi:hypothetical protein
MGIASEAAPEIDRLVLGVRRSRPELDARLAELARERGLESLELLPTFGDFLLQGALTKELAILRMPYTVPARVLGRLDELQKRRFIEQRDSGLAALPILRPLLEAMAAARTEAAADAWHDHRGDVSTATEIAGVIGQAASDDHVVAVAHQKLSDPADPYLLLDHRLVTLRYIRQHDHVAAWTAQGLTAPAVVLLTKLWEADRLADPGDGLTQLTELGLVDAEPLSLTAKGREVREAIEAETNQRAQETFDVLDEAAGVDFLAALRRLPGNTG